jgi:hypothetical protein
LPSAKALAWIGSIATAAIIAFVSTFAAVIATKATSPDATTAPPSGEPVQVTLGNVNGADLSMALPKPTNLSAQQLNYLGSVDGIPGSGFAGWFAAHDAAFVGQADIQLVVQGNRHNLVRIINIAPIERCSAPLHGTMFFAPGQGGQDQSAQLYVNLDRPKLPIGYSLQNSLKILPDYFKHYSIPLAFGSQFTFQITVSTLRQYCELTLDLIVLDGSETVVERVTDHGAPFRITPLSASESDNKISFPGYSVLYLGGAAIPDGYNDQNTGSGELWIRGNPKTFTWYNA